jgi:hypothetical protein
MEKTYNGWSNYATWRINLELVDDMHEMLKEHGVFEDIGELKSYLKEAVEEAVTGYGNVTSNPLAESYAMAFIEDVNYHEIAEVLIDTDSSLIKK